MPDSPRKRAYIWTTWITGLLAGTDACMWKAWYKSHFRYAKLEENSHGFDIAEWTRQHDAMTAARVKQLKDDGRWTSIREEDENAFKLSGRNADLSGKPDIVALSRHIQHALVIDEKSGKKKESDVWQVLLYMFALPLVWASGWRVEGEIEYRDGKRAVDPDRIVSARPRIVEVIKVVGDPEEPLRTPSPSECRFCDIQACPDRIVVKAQAADVSKIF